jgi:hypothetical protein
MKAIDFFFYYLVQFFDVTDPKFTKFKSHTDQAAYVLTICSILWLILINEVLEYILFSTFKSKIPNLIFIAVGLGLYFLYRNIYIKKDRYNLILEEPMPRFNVSDISGRIIAVMVVLFPIIILIASLIINNIK